MNSNEQPAKEEEAMVVDAAVGEADALFPCRGGGAGLPRTTVRAPHGGDKTIVGASRCRHRGGALLNLEVVDEN